MASERRYGPKIDPNACETFVISSRLDWPYKNFDVCWTHSYSKQYIHVIPPTSHPTHLLTMLA